MERRGKKKYTVGVVSAEEKYHHARSIYMLLSIDQTIVYRLDYSLQTMDYRLWTMDYRRILVLGILYRYVDYLSAAMVGRISSFLKRRSMMASSPAHLRPSKSSQYQEWLACRRRDALFVVVRSEWVRRSTSMDQSRVSFRAARPPSPPLQGHPRNENGFVEVQKRSTV